MKVKGRIEVITGSMFSGKTTEWARRLEREKIARKRIVYFKPEFENRYGADVIADRNKKNVFKANLLPVNGTAKDIQDIIRLVDNYDVIGIDEAMFLGSWIINLCETLRRKNKKVVLNGLDMTYEGNPFGHMGSLMAIADDVEKLHAVCIHCGDDALYNQRLLDGEPAPVGDLVEIGDNTENVKKISYEARCLACFVPPEEVETNKQKIAL